MHVYAVSNSKTILRQREQIYYRRLVDVAPYAAGLVFLLNLSGSLDHFLSQTTDGYQSGLVIRHIALSTEAALLLAVFISASYFYTRLLLTQKRTPGALDAILKTAQVCFCRFLMQLHFYNVLTLLPDD